ncbi:exported hypothetical protein [Verrucomicrobia bacterium]|nr:exported hypothetical protein [Verrucomicrobiota bacterium]
MKRHTLESYATPCLPVRRPGTTANLAALPVAVLLLLGLALPARAQHFLFTNIWVQYCTNGTGDLKADGNNRNVAYNAVSNQVYVGYRGSPSAVDVFDGAAGSFLGTLPDSSTVATYSVGVGDDGVIYGVPLANGVSGANLNIYSWTNWQSDIYHCYVQSGSDATSLGQVQGKRVGDSMAVTGAGANTLILLWVNVGINATNYALLFSTTDGVNFTPTLLYVPSLPVLFNDAGPQHGLAFYTNNTFLVKVGTSLYEVQYPANSASLPSPVTATIIGTNSVGGSTGQSYELSYSPPGNLLAVLGPMVNSTPASLEVNLFGAASFANLNNEGTTNAPHFTSNGNLTGGVALGGAGKTNALYVLDSNNALWAWSLTFVAAPVAPSITTAPVGGSAYTNIGSFTFTVTAAGSAPLFYQWQFNTASNLATATSISLATNSSYTINPLTTSASGWYDVVISNTAGVTSSVPVLLSVSTGFQSPYVTNLWALAADNSEPYLDTSYNTRGLAFDPSTMSVLVAEHATVNIYVLNATNGSLEYELTTPSTGLPSGSIFPLGQVVVADDGVAYCCNVSSYQPGQQTGNNDFSITRFDAVINPTNANYNFEVAWTGDPGAFQPLNPGASSQDRWGDSMAVRGAGTNTQILLGTYETIGANEFGTGPGTNVAILTTTDGTNFTSTTIAVTNAPDGFSYLGVAWGTNNTFWTKSPGFDLRQVQYDLTTGIGTVIQDFSSTASAGSLNQIAGIGLDNSNNILAGVNLGDTPNDLELFQIPSAGFPPQAYYQAFFPAYNPNINGNAATTIKYPYIFSLDANNGIIALTYAIPPPPIVPYNITAVTNHAGSVVLTWQSVAQRTYQVQYTGAVLANNTAWTNLGSPITATNSTTTYTDATSPRPAARYYRISGH